MSSILCGRKDMPRHTHDSVEAVRTCQRVGKFGGQEVVSIAGVGSSEAAKKLKVPLGLVKDIPEAYYAIASADGTKYTFWRVGVQKDDDGNIISWRLQMVPRRKSRDERVKLREVLLITCKGGTDWATADPAMIEQVESTIKRILVDGDALVRDYGKQTERCGLCNTELTDDQSKALGVGPICLKRNPHYADDDSLE